MNARSYLEQCAFARELGARMADAGFSLEDNPYTSLHPRLCEQWASGFGALNVGKQVLRRSARRPQLARAGGHS